MQLTYSYLGVLFRCFLKAFREGVLRRRKKDRRAGKYSRKDSICSMSGYGKLEDSDRIVNGQEQMSA